MLHYFTLPYPDEIWYSALCRYHVRTGNSSSLATIRQLLGKNTGQIGCFFPNNTIYEILKNLPDGTLDIEEIILNHTLFKCLARFHAFDEKRKMLDDAKKGKMIPNPSRGTESHQRILKMCPLCRKEDTERYGEPYWHVKHQIPYIGICHKHKCKLKIIKCQSINSRNQNFILPPECNEQEEYLSSHECQFNEMLLRYQELPYHFGPTHGYNNIIEGLINAGYCTFRKDYGFILDRKKIAHALGDFYGDEFILQMTGSKEIPEYLFTQIRTWALKSSEKYALITTLIGQDPSETFGKKIHNVILDKFKCMADEKKVTSRAAVAKELGIKLKDVEPIAEFLNADVFWKPRNCGKIKKKDHVHVLLPEGKKSEILNYIEGKPYSGISEFLLECAEKEMFKK